MTGSVVSGNTGWVGDGNAGGGGIRNIVGGTLAFYGARVYTDKGDGLRPSDGERQHRKAA